MNAPRSEPFDVSRFEATYTQYFGLLVRIAAHEFHVPDSDAEALAHDVLLGYLWKAGNVKDIQSHLIGAISHASRHYLRLNAATPRATVR